MGYDADFSFDFTIPSAKVDQAEKALLAHIANSSKSDNPNYDNLDWILTETDSKTLAALFNAAWHADVAFEQEIAPLVALATLSTRGDIVFSDYVSKSWREYEEPILDVLAPFVEDGGTVRYKGEDFDCEQVWTFKDGVRRAPINDVFDKATVEETLAKLKRALSLLTDAVTFCGEDSALTKMIQPFLDEQSITTEK